LGYFSHGEKAAIARLAEIEPSHLYEILSRKRGVGKHKAKELEAASEKVLGYPIPLEAWLFNAETLHPAFDKIGGER